MKEKEFNFETWLPLFPGFYSTTYEVNWEQLIWTINNIRSDKGLNEIEDIDLIDFDNDQYEWETMRDFAKVFQSHLNEMLDTNIEITLQNIQHPREYNFRNDSGDISVWMNEEDLLKIQLAIYNKRKKVHLYLEDRYTSGPGFISFYSNKFKDWQEATDNFLNWEKDTHHLGAMLEALFIVLTDEEQDIMDESYDFLLFEETTMDIYPSEYIINYDDCMESEVCHVCNDHFVDKTWRDEYDSVCMHYQESWNQMTGGQKLPRFYSFEEWMKKQNTYDGRVCAYCIDDEDVREYL